MNMQTIFDYVPVLLFYKDKENTFVKVNKHLALLWNMTPELLEGKTCYELMPEDQAVAVHDDDLEVIRTGEPKKNIIEPITNLNGITRWFRTDKVPYRDANGKIIGVIGFAIDITEQRAMQQNLLLMQKALEQTSSTVAITDLDGKLIFVNDKFQKVTGYKYNEVLGKNPKILKSNKMEKSTYESLWNTVTSGKSWRGEFINKTKDGNLYWELATISPIFNDSNKITHYVKVAEILDDRKHSMLNMWNMFEYSSYYVLMLDDKMQIKLCNRVLADVLGYGEHELIGKYWNEFVPENMQQVIKHVHMELIQGNAGYREFTNEIIQKDGELQTVKWFNSWINHDTNWVFCFGVPIEHELFINESIDTMRERYKDIISVHRAIIDEFKKKTFEDKSKQKA